MVPQLPEDIVREIFKHCRQRDAKRAMRVSHMWKRASEPKVFQTVTLRNRAITRLNECERRFRYVRTLIVLDTEMFAHMVNVLPKMINLRNLHYGCRGSILELHAATHYNPRQDLRVTIDLPDFYFSYEADLFLAALEEAYSSITKKYYIEMDTTITALSFLRSDAFSMASSVGIYFGDYAQMFETTLIEHAADRLKSVKSLHIFADYWSDEIELFLTEIGGDNIEKLTIASRINQPIIPPWGVTKHKRQIVYCSHPSKEDYTRVHDTPTKINFCTLPMAGYFGRDRLSIVCPGYRHETQLIKSIITKAKNSGRFAEVSFLP